MRKLFLLFFILLVSQISFANPQFYNYNNGTSYNSFPFNQAAGKMIQTLVAAGEFNQPSGAPSGNITGYSVRISTGYPLGPVTYTNFRILFLDTNLTALPTALVTGAWDTVFFRASAGPYTAGADTWLDFTLDHPHAYNNTRSLVIQIEQCGASGSFAGFSLQHTTTATNRRTYSVGGCPFSYQGTSLYVVNCGINVAPPPPPVPELMYYKFEDNPSATLVKNCGSAPVGTNPAPLSGDNLTSGGQFDTCIVGTGTTGTNGVNTGWNCNLGSNNWTISFWVTGLAEVVAGNPVYLFGDPGSTTFRCFYGGFALPNNCIIRGPMPDLIFACPMPGTYVFHIVYNGTTLKIYRNGVFLIQSSTTITMPTGTGFRVGGYTGGAYALNTGGKMDEFRLYNRALDTAEISASWNTDLGGCGTPLGINNNNNIIPKTYSLSQNYPNPFNPVTKISFALPKAGDVELKVYDMLGREVATLVHGNQPAGNHSIDFDASSLASGVYLYKIVAGDFIDTKKMMLIK